MIPAVAFDAPAARSRSLGAYAVGVTSTSVVGITSVADGGYFPPAVAWLALAALYGLTLALLLTPRLERPRELAPAAALAGFGAVVAARGILGDTPFPETEVTRAVAYAAILALAVLALRETQVPALVGGVVAGAVVCAGWALATRLFPARAGIQDAIADNRLAEPIGYWNGLGLLCGIGLLLALGLVADIPVPAVRALAGAAVPVLALAAYFTFSRGAIAATCLGLVAAVGLHSRPVRPLAALLTLATPVACLIAAAVESEELARPTVSAAARDQGGNLAVWLIAAAAVAALGGLAAPRLASALPTFLPRVAAVMLAVTALGAGTAGVVRAGGPGDAVHAVASQFRAPPTVETDLNQRLFSLSGSYRVDIWSAAWDAFEDEPWLGVGSGNFERQWLQRRELPLKVRDAHSLYLETLTETGPVGLALVVFAFAFSLARGVRSRAAPLVPAATAVVLAYVVHAGIDWDWELPAVSVAALLAAAAGIVSAPRNPAARPAPRRLRVALISTAVPLTALAIAAVIATAALARATQAASAADWDRAIAHAERAATWAPWSPEPQRELGEAYLAVDSSAAAEASFRRALAKDKGDWQLWFDLARGTVGADRERALAAAHRLNPLSREIARLRQELQAQERVEVAG